MAADRMQRAMPWLLGVTIVVFGGIIALVLIGRTYAPDHIHEAARNGNVVLVWWFVLVRPDVLEAPDAFGLTSLHLAAMEGHPAVVQTLLTAGADANARDTKGETPLHLAAYYGHLDAAEVPLARGAHADAKDADGRMLLQRATRRAHLDGVEGLLGNPWGSGRCASVAIRSVASLTWDRVQYEA